MDAPKMGRGRVWLDVTTTTHAGGHFDGTTRVERSLIRELPQYLAERLGFCAYNRTLRHFSEVARPASDRRLRPAKLVASVAAGAVQSERLSNRSCAALSKAPSAQVASSTDRLLGRSLFPEAAAGDTLLLAGENWSRHDFAVLRRLKQRDGLRIAALLQDMIPHVRPQFFESPAFIARFRTYVDFLVDDADLVFAISDCTRNDFLNAAPAADPAKVVRVELGAEIGSAGRQQRPADLGAMGERPFVLSVSTIQVRKNFDLLYRLWQKFSIDGRGDQPHLVIVGREGFGSADCCISCATIPRSPAR